MYLILQGTNISSSSPLLDYHTYQHQPMNKVFVFPVATPYPVTAIGHPQINCGEDNLTD